MPSGPPTKSAPPSPWPRCTPSRSNCPSWSAPATREASLARSHRPRRRPPTAPGEGVTALAGNTPTLRPRVSVIVVNWNGRDHLDACFSSLLASDYPAALLELICVDNGSVDDSRALLAERFPAVRVVALDENRGFTGGNAAGVAAATGDVFVFVNNDMKFEPTLIPRLVDAIADACRLRRAPAS